MTPYYKNDLITLYQGDCLEIMPQLDMTFDCCITDPPYGSIKGINLLGWDNSTTVWDNAINPKDIFNSLSKIIRQNGRIILFSQEPYTSNLIVSTNGNIKFCQKAVFIKSKHANPFGVNKSMLKYHEDICVFQKMYDKNNTILSNYFKSIIDYLGVSANVIIKTLGDRKAVHCLYYNDPQFELCIEETYNRIVNLFHIDQMTGYMPYSELKRIDEMYSTRFNLWENGKYKKDIFQYSPDKKHLHPTQKPVALIEDLVKTYTNENELVLDFTCGSGTTGIACMNTKRKCVLIERDEKYCEITIKRLQEKEKEMSERLF